MKANGISLLENKNFQRTPAINFVSETARRRIFNMLSSLITNTDL